jgi:hypothetical protein
MRSSRRKDSVRNSSPSESSSRINARRGFLLALGAGGAGAAALAARKLTSSVAPAAGTAAEDEAGQSYRLTDHVKRYYETTKT